MIVHGYRPTPNALVLSRSGPMGERCMKDTVHPPVHPSVHPAARTSVTTTSPCRSSDTHFGRGQNTGLGWNDPGLAAFPRPNNLLGRSSPVFCPWLSLHFDRNNAGDRVLRVKTVKNASCTCVAATSSPSVQVSPALSTNSCGGTCASPTTSPQIERRLHENSQINSPEEGNRTRPGPCMRRERPRRWTHRASRLTLGRSRLTLQQSQLASGSVKELCRTNVCGAAYNLSDKIA